MAQKHQGSLNIDRFLGFNQSADNLGLSYAMAGYNFSIKHGVLQSARSATLNYATDTNPDFNYKLAEYDTLDIRNDVKTLAFISQRWKDGYSGAIPADITWAVSVFNGKIYARMHAGGTSTEFHNTDWIEVYDGVFQNDLFDCVTYEINYAPPEILTNNLLIEIMNKTASAYAYDKDDYAYHIVDFHNITDDDGTEHEHPYYLNNDGEEVVINVGEAYVRRGYDYPVDALIISNAKDGMYLVYCSPVGAGNTPVLKVVKITVKPEGNANETKFGCIARYAERIWGAGIETDPDKLMYCAPYDIFNWEQNNNEPDDGAGDIQQPDWDGDGFRALKAFGNQLVCFKKNSIWALTGTSPSAFYMRKQYGHGTIYEDSIAVYNGNMFFVTDTGIHAYDSINVTPVRYGYLSKAFDDFAICGRKTVVGCMCEGNYYFSLLTYDPAFYECFFRYDTLEGTLSAIKGIFPYALCENDGIVYAITTDGKKGQLGSVKPGGIGDLYYQTGWNDLGAKNVEKSEFEIYLTPEVTMNDNVEIEIGIETEKKKKSKSVVFTSGKTKRIRLNAKGRKFRLWLKAKNQDDPWKLVGGIQIVYSLDYD